MNSSRRNRRQRGAANLNTNTSPSARTPEPNANGSSSSSSQNEINRPVTGTTNEIILDGNNNELTVQIPPNAIKTIRITTSPSLAPLSNRKSPNSSTMGNETKLSANNDTNDINEFKLPPVPVSIYAPKPVHSFSIHPMDPGKQNPSPQSSPSPDILKYLNPFHPSHFAGLAENPPAYTPTANGSDSTPIIDPDKVASDSHVVEIPPAGALSRNQSTLDPEDTKEVTEGNTDTSIDTNPPASNAYYSLILYFVTIAVIAGVASASTAIYAMMNPSGEPPENIGEEWWDNMSTGTKINSMVTLLFSLIANYPFAFDSIPAAVHTVRTKLFKANQTRTEKIENAVTVTLGTSAAFASATIAYNSFTWIFNKMNKAPGIGIEAAISISSLVINFTTRYGGIKNLINRIRGFFDRNTQLKIEFMEDLKYVAKKHRPRVNRYIRQAYHNNANQLNDKTLIEILEKLTEAMEKYPDLLIKPTQVDSAKHYGMLSIQILSALFVGISAYSLFTQKGYDGINQLSEWIFDYNMDDLDPALKGLIGSMPGLATAMLYAVSSLDFPQLVAGVANEIWVNPTFSEVALFIAVIGINAFASASLESITQGVLKKDSRIFHFLAADNAVGFANTELNRFGAFVANTNASLRRVFGKANYQTIDVITLTKDLAKLSYLDTPPLSSTAAALDAFSAAAHPETASSLEDPADVVVHQGYGSTSNTDDKAVAVVSHSRPSTAMTNSLNRYMQSGSRQQQRNSFLSPGNHSPLHTAALPPPHLTHSRKRRLGL